MTSLLAGRPRPDMSSAAGMAAVRADFPILEREVRGTSLVYLDTGATSQRPLTVIEAEREFYLRSNAAVHRGAHALAEEATEAYEAGRAAVARFVGGEFEEIVFGKNATEGLNLVANAFLSATLDSRAGRAADPRFVLREGDEIVVTVAEHHANLVPWQMVARRTGAHLRWLGLTDEGRIDLGTLSVITDRTRVVAFTHVSNVTGAISPVEEIVAAAKAVGAVVVLDACQSFPHMALDLPAMGVDAAAFSAHKALGPTGVGALWGRPDFLAAMPPMLSGGSMVEVVTMDTATFLPPPARFEAGSQMVAQVAAWRAAVDYLNWLGMDQVAAREQALTERLHAGITQIPGNRVLGPTTAVDRVGAVAFVVDGVHPHDASQVLDDDGIAVRVGHHCAQPVHRRLGAQSSVRASIGVHTTEDEIDTFLAALPRVAEFFGVTHG